MAIASAYGLNYELPQQGVSAQTGQPVLPENYGQSDLLSDELYVKEGLTDEYYKEVAALKSFANEVSSRYGFDVTRPNYRNSESIKYHRAYMEALTNLQNKKNNLRRLASHENLSLQNPDIAMRTDESGNDYFANMGQGDIVSTMAAAIPHIKSREGLAGFNEAKSQLIEKLNDDMSAAKTARERDQISAQIRGLESLSPDVGTSDYQSSILDIQNKEFEANQKYRDAQLGIEREKLNIERDKPRNIFGSLNRNQAVLVAGRIKNLEELTSPETLKTMGFDRVDRDSGTYLERTIDGKKESVRLNPNDPMGTLNNINELLNKSKGTPVTMDLLQESGLDLEDVAGEIIGRIKPVEDKYSSFVESFPDVAKRASSQPAVGEAISESLNNEGVIIPASVASLFSNGVSEDSPVGKVEYNSGGWFGDPTIKITLKKKRTGDKTRTIELSLVDDSDISLIQDIFRDNSRQVSLPKEISGIVVAPDTGGGPSIDVDKL